jgi:hypothetical protein
MPCFLAELGPVARKCKKMEGDRTDPTDASLALFPTLPNELLISIFRWLEAADIMSLRLTSSQLYRVTLDDAAVWRPLFLKVFAAAGTRPCKPSGRGPNSTDLWEDYHLHIPQAKAVDVLVRRFQQTWEWAYKVRLATRYMAAVTQDDDGGLTRQAARTQSRALDLVALTRKGATCYAAPKVRFPPPCWVARRDEATGLWRYEGEWTPELKRCGWRFQPSAPSPALWTNLLAERALVHAAS